MTLTYDLEPSQPLSVINGGSNDVSSMVSFPNTEGVVLTSAIIDPDTDKLVINVDYTKDIQGEQLNLQIVPPDTPQASLTPNISHSWTI